MVAELPFPHPLSARGPDSFTPAEAAFFREALRRLAEFLGRGVNLTIRDGMDPTGVPFYTLTARWADPTEKRHRLSGHGSTPGEALTRLINKARPTS